MIPACELLPDDEFFWRNEWVVVVTLNWRAGRVLVRDDRARTHDLHEQERVEVVRCGASI